MHFYPLHIPGLHDKDKDAILSFLVAPVSVQVLDLLNWEQWVQEDDGRHDDCDNLIGCWKLVCWENPFLSLDIDRSNADTKLYCDICKSEANDTHFQTQSHKEAMMKANKHPGSLLQEILQKGLSSECCFRWATSSRMMKAPRHRISCGIQTLPHHQCWKDIQLQ